MLASRVLLATIADEKSRVGNALILIAVDAILWRIPARVETAVRFVSQMACRIRARAGEAVSSKIGRDCHGHAYPHRARDSGFRLRGGTRGVPPRRGRTAACRGTG